MPNKIECRPYPKFKKDFNLIVYQTRNLGEWETDEALCFDKETAIAWINQLPETFVILRYKKT
jgi:hypothetical protein